MTATRPRVSRFGTPARPPADRVRETEQQIALRQAISSGNRRRKPSMPKLPAHWAQLDDEDPS